MLYYIQTNISLYLWLVNDKNDGLISQRFSKSQHIDMCQDIGTSFFLVHVQVICYMVIQI